MKRDMALNRLENRKNVLLAATTSVLFFKKELVESLACITKNEQIQLRDWVKTHFKESYQVILDSVFTQYQTC